MITAKNTEMIIKLYAGESVERKFKEKGVVTIPSSVF